LRVGPNSLGLRLFAAIALALMLSLSVTLVVGAALTRRAVEQATLRDLAHQADLLASRERTSIAPLAHLAELRSYLARQGERVVTVPLGASSPYFSQSDAEKLASGASIHGTATADGKRFFFAAVPVGGAAFIVLRTAHLGASTWRPYLEGLLIAVLGGGTLAALVSFLLARAIARPVRRVADATRTLAEQRSPQALSEEGVDELRSLVRSFNEMAERLARARAAERVFLLSVSHELKTPLTAIRGYAEALAESAVSVDDASETIRREAARLERLVQDLLDLARLNRSEFSIRSEPIDLADAVHEVVRRYAVQARAFGVALEAVADMAAPAVGDGDRVLQVVSNLVENALRLTPSGGFVRVHARPGTVEVEDSGPGLRPDELTRAFERFFLYSRYGHERPVGTGLGLAIVQELVEGMGGTVAAQSEDGMTSFRCRLPLPDFPALQLDSEPQGRESGALPIGTPART
jgi:two-component system OmpR family sensor kinase